MSLLSFEAASSESSALVLALWRCGERRREKARWGNVNELLDAKIGEGIQDGSVHEFRVGANCMQSHPWMQLSGRLAILTFEVVHSRGN